jgi:hypothetical protein
MSRDETFLARWSRRKRRAASQSSGFPPATRDKDPSPPFRGEREGPAKREGEVGCAAAFQWRPAGKIDLDFSPDSPAPAGEGVSAVPLPSIDAIESAPDIKAFLAPGVPLELTRAALRRAWTADPAIRDFIGLSENAWDFNIPGGVPGFGSLGREDIHRLVGQVFGAPHEAAPTPATAALADQSATRAEAASGAPIAEPRESTAAPQHQSEESKTRECRPGRHHGGALPK